MCGVWWIRRSPPAARRRCRITCHHRNNKILRTSAEFCTRCRCATSLPSGTGCSLNIVVFFSKTVEYSGLLPFSVLSLCQCVYTHQAGRTPALQQNWQSSEKSQNFKEKTQFLMNTLYNLSYNITC